MKPAVIALVALAGGTVSASAETVEPNMTGNAVYEICSAQNDMTKQGFCLGYIVGIVEGMKWGAAVPMMRAEIPRNEVNGMVDMFLGFCLPEGATWGQYRDVIVGYLQKNPAERHTSARLLAQLALAEAFPCETPLLEE